MQIYNLIKGVHSPDSEECVRRRRPSVRRYECYARVEAPDWGFSDKRVSIFRPNITPKRLGY